MSVTIRPVTPADADAIAAIYAPYVAETVISFEATPPDAAEMARRIATVTANYPWLVAEADGQLAGYAYATRYRDRAAYDWAVETAIYVDRARPRRGVGRALYAALLDMLEDRGFVTAIACLTLPNRASVAFHEALDFEPAGVQPRIGFKAGKWHDIGFWQLDLAPRKASPERPRG